MPHDSFLKLVCSTDVPRVFLASGAILGALAVFKAGAPVAGTVAAAHTLAFAKIVLVLEGIKLSMLTADPNADTSEIDQLLEQIDKLASAPADLIDGALKGLGLGGPADIYGIVSEAKDGSWLTALGDLLQLVQDMVCPPHDALDQSLREGRHDLSGGWSEKLDQMNYLGEQIEAYGGKQIA